MGQLHNLLFYFGSFCWSALFWQTRSKCSWTVFASYWKASFGRRIGSCWNRRKRSHWQRSRLRVISQLKWSKCLARTISPPCFGVSFCKDHWKMNSTEHCCLSWCWALGWRCWATRVLRWAGWMGWGVYDFDSVGIELDRRLQILMDSCLFTLKWLTFENFLY